MEGLGAFAALAPLLFLQQCAAEGYYEPGLYCDAPYPTYQWCCYPREYQEFISGLYIQVPLNRSCDGSCHQDRFYTFVAPCENSDICMPDLALCNGTHQCQDRGDLNWCSQPQRKQEECHIPPIFHDQPFGRQWQSDGIDFDPNFPPQVRCEGGIPGQCIDERKKRDGTTYDCIDRSDEPLVLPTPNKTLNFTEIQPCDITLCYDWKTECVGEETCETIIDVNGRPSQQCRCSEYKKRCAVEHKFKEAGLTCGDECVWVKDWCKQSTAHQCSNLNNRSTTDPELCSNFTFWAGKDCGPPNYYRCTGSWSGQCGFRGKPCYESDKYCVNREMCIDKSDAFLLLEKEKNAETWHPEECTTIQGKPGLTCLGAPDQRCLELSKWCDRYNTDMEKGHSKDAWVYSSWESTISRLDSIPSLVYPNIYQCGPGKYNTSLSISVCSNSTLMANVPCRGKRCSGSYMECMPEWDLGPYVIPPSCLDGSDRNLNLSVSVFDATTFSTTNGSLASMQNYSSYSEYFNTTFGIEDYQQENITIRSALILQAGFITIRPPGWYEGFNYAYYVEECIKAQGFLCMRANTKVCLHPSIRCNGHPECDDASDEESCEEENPLGGFRCPSPHHNQENNATFTPWVTIFATRCDSKPECWGGVDEQGCNNDWTIYFVIGVVLATLALVTISCPTILTQVFGKSEDNGSTSHSGCCTILKTLVEGSIDDVKKVVLNPGFALAVTQMQHLDLPREVRRSRNRQLIFCLGNSQAEAFARLKNMANKETARQVIQDFQHSDTNMNRLADAIEDLQTPLKKIYDKVRCVKDSKPTQDGLFPYLISFANVVLSYLDVTKDSALVIKLVSLIGVQIFTEPTIFQSVIIWLLTASIIVPLLKSAVETALWYPNAVLDSTVSPPSGHKLKVLQAAVFCGYFFVPSLLIFNRKKANLKKKILLEKSKEEFHSNGVTEEQIQEELQDIEKYEEEVKEAYLIFKRNEASFEIVLQMGLQLTMLLLSMTTFPTHAGLQGVFGKDYSKHENILRAQFGTVFENVNFSEWLLVGSITLSFKTVCTTFIWIKTEKKSHNLGVAAKSVLGLRSFLFSTSRIFALVAFFGPFLGLMDCHAHWKAQRRPLNIDLLKRINDSSNSYWDKDTIQSLYKTLSSSEFTEYTVLSLRAAFFILLGSSLFVSLVIFLVKKKLSADFKASSWGGQLQHVVEVINFPDAFLDWDDDSGNNLSKVEYKVRWRSVLRETTVMVLLHCSTNFLLLVPLVVTTSKIQARHELIVATIGAFEEEQEAFDLMSRLIWQLPLFMAITALLDLILVVVYMNWLHPWRGILEDGPEIWGPLSEKEGSLEVPIQSDCHENMLMKSLSKKPEEGDAHCDQPTDN